MASFETKEVTLLFQKKKFPEITLLYSNQGVITNLKAEDRATYLDYIILAQILPASLCPPNIDNYEFAENELLLLVPLYYTKNRCFRGLKKWLGFITICGDPDEQY